MPNQVTLTFAGDESALDKSFQNVGASAQRMGQDVGDAYDRAAEASDRVDTRAMGFRDTLTGIQDGATGIKQAASGDWGFETLLLLGTGVGDLASGLTNFLIPGFKALRTSTMLQTAATNVASAATKGFTLAQNLLRAAFLTSPIGWIVLGIGALIAVVVLIATKTTWFQTIWRNAWSWIKTAASNTWEFIRSIPGAVTRVFSRIGDAVSSPFKAGFNAVARAWNNTVGSLSWTVPGWVPFIGGNTISAPRLSTFHSGGVVPGIAGTAVPIMALAGERVSSGASGAGRPVTVVAGDELVRALLVQLAAEVNRAGGDPATLGIRVNG